MDHKYIRKLPGTGKAVALVFNRIQQLRSKYASSWCPSSDEDIWLFSGWSMLLLHLKRWGQDAIYCHILWEDLRQKAIKLNLDSSKLPRKKRASTKIEQFFSRKAAAEYANDVILHYCRIYCESLTCIINAIENWFDQETFRNWKYFVESSQKWCPYPRVQWCYDNIRQQLWWK